MLYFFSFKNHLHFLLINPCSIAFSTPKFQECGKLNAKMALVFNFKCQNGLKA